MALSLTQVSALPYLSSTTSFKIASRLTAPALTKPSILGHEHKLECGKSRPCHHQMTLKHGHVSLLGAAESRLLSRHQIKYHVPIENVERCSTLLYTCKVPLERAMHANA